MQPDAANLGFHSAMWYSGSVQQTAVRAGSTAWVKGGEGGGGGSDSSLAPSP